MAAPPGEPAELSLSHTLKRKRGDSLEGDIPALASEPDQQDHEPSETPSEADDFFDDDPDLYGDEPDADVENDMLEEIADAMAVKNDENALRLTYTPSEVRSMLKEYGIRDFITQVLSETGMTARALGASLGVVDEGMLDDESYRYLLSRVLVRTLMRRRKLLQYSTIDDAAKLLQDSKHIMILTGAGISTSLGIPDFRSKGTGFYSKLQDMGFSEPEEVFDIGIFDASPEIFYSLAGDILPEGKAFTPTHAFIRLIQDKGKLQTNYTQNIDNLEANAGISSEKVIQCHGSFATASCRKCKDKIPGADIFDDIRAKSVAQCKRCIAELAHEEKSRPKGKGKRKWSDHGDDFDDDIPTPGVMKPDITFFGEQLPDDFFERFLTVDSREADLVIVIGTSLKVAPVSEMPNNMPEHVPHIYISREPCAHINFDIQLLGDCDHVVWELARRAGWQLDHDMIPEALKVEVKEHLDSGSQWTVIQANPSTVDT